MITRCSMATTLSPGSGYFQERSTGWPTFVSTRYMSPTLRSSCCCVAIFFESGDQSRIGRSLLTHPALSVAYPKSFAPSVVSCFSCPEATSRTHRFHSRMNAARLPSGDTTVLPAPPARPPPPPPRPPRPLAAERVTVSRDAAQRVPRVSHAHRLDPVPM